MCEAETEEEQHKLHRADVQQLLLSKEEVPPEQQEWSPSLDQEDPAELPHIKEEQEELWTSQEGEQLRGLEEADIIKFTFTSVPVKSEEEDDDDEDEEKPQSSQLQQSQTEENRDAEHLKTEADGEDCGGSEPTRNFNPDSHLQTATHDKTSHSSECETDDSCDLEETREPLSGLNLLQNNEVPACDEECNTGKTSVIFSESTTSFRHKRHLQKYNVIKSLHCSVCGKRYHLKNSLTSHVRLQSEGKRFSCSVCRPIAEYKEEHCRQHKILDAVLNPDVRLHRTDIPQLSVSKEEVLPEQQEWSPSLEQEDPPELPHIKEEKEEFWTSQEGEQLQRLEETDIIKFTFSPVSVKSEEDDEEEKPQSSQLHECQTEQIKTEVDEEDCGESEPDRNLNPVSHLQPDIGDETTDFPEPETDDSCEWEETREPQSGLNPLQNNEVPVSDIECNTEEPLISFSESATSFGLKGHLQKVRGIQTGEKPFSCSVCGKRYRLKNSLTAHMRLHLERKRFSCSVCKKTFQWRGQVVTHMRIHTGEKPFTCSVCGKGFARKYCLSHHSTVHTGEKPFSCSVCGIGFTRNKYLRRHSTVHTGEKPFSCSVCGKGFALKGLLRRHLTVHTGEKPFSCSVCGKGFTQKGHLRQHSATHTGEKPFICSVCGKGFAVKGNLRRHSAVHTGEKPYICSLCGKGFALKGNLTQHLTIHTGEKPFSCSVCGMRFAQNSNLTKHLRVHTGEKPFNCTVCGKGFTRKGRLRRHSTVHRGEKPFSCSVCGIGFALKEELRRHSTAHTRAKLISCSVCDKGFTQLTQLKKHKCVGESSRN